MFPFFVFLKVEDIFLKGVECAEGMGRHEAEVRFPVVNFAPEFCCYDEVAGWHWGKSCDKKHAILGS